MVEKYRELEKPDLSFDLSVRVLEIQSEDFNFADYFDYAYGGYDQSYLEALSQEQRDSLIQEF